MNPPGDRVFATKVEPPKPGDVVYVDKSASVQFAGAKGFNFRVVRVDDKPTYEGWAWINGYVLNTKGDAVAKRDIFVRPDGLKPATPRNRRMRRREYE